MAVQFRKPSRWFVSGVLGASVLIALIGVSSPDTAFFSSIFVIAPILALLTLGMLVHVVASRGRSLWFPVAMAALWAVAIISFFSGPRIRPYARWLFFSRSYKQEVLAEPPSATGDLRHMEGDGWGFAGADTSVYLVFDPGNTLSAAAARNASGTLAGIPCGISQVRRLEPQWYQVTLYTDEHWGQC
jgi:hypothetical protein